MPESKDRHRRTPPPASYPRHRRPHREHRDLAAPVGRTEITSTSSSVPSSPSNQNPSTVVRSTRRTFRHTLDARTPFPVPVVLTSTARNPTGHGVSPNPCQETHPRERHKGPKIVADHLNVTSEFVESLAPADEPAPVVWYDLSKVRR